MSDVDSSLSEQEGFFQYIEKELGMNMQEIWKVLSLIIKKENCIKSFISQDKNFEKLLNFNGNIKNIWIKDSAECKSPGRVRFSLFHNSEISLNNLRKRYEIFKSFSPGVKEEQLSETTLSWKKVANHMETFGFKWKLIYIRIISSKKIYEGWIDFDQRKVISFW